MQRWHGQCSSPTTHMSIIWTTGFSARRSSKKWVVDSSYVFCKRKKRLCLPPMRKRDRRKFNYSPITAVVRCLFKMGRKLVERRLNTLRRLFARSTKTFCPMPKKRALYIVFFINTSPTLIASRWFNSYPAEMWPKLICNDGNFRLTDKRTWIPLRTSSRSSKSSSSFFFFLHVLSWFQAV